MNKNVLVEELNLIQSPEIKEWTAKTLQNAPDYFFIAQASSTGKYHPECTLGEGGLIIHVSRAVYIANRLCGGWGITGIDKDIVISATILHDIAKVGRGSGSYADYENHPLNAEKYFLNTTLSSEIKNKINDCIKNHMGLWSPKSTIKPLKDYSLLELIVYTSDYIATTKDLVTPEDKKEGKIAEPKIEIPTNKEKMMIRIIRMNKVVSDKKTKAYVDVDFFGMMIKGIRVVEGKDGLFIAYLDERGRDDKYYETVYPSNITVRTELENLILAHYKNN